jgi:hypothetical protein
MAEAIGLTLAKLAGKYHVDVLNSRWDTKRADQQHITGAGVKQAIGFPVSSGSFDQVIPKVQDLDWTLLEDFSIEIYDTETRSIVIASFEKCNWTSLGGSSDLASANTRKSVTWVCSRTVKP